MNLPRKVKYKLQLCRDHGLVGEKKELTEGIKKGTAKTKDYLGSYMETYHNRSLLKFVSTWKSSI